MRRRDLLDLGEELGPPDDDALCFEQGDELRQVLLGFVAHTVRRLHLAEDHPGVAVVGVGELLDEVVVEEEPERDVVGVVEVERRPDDDLLERRPVVVRVHDRDRGERVGRGRLRRGGC